MPTHTVNTSNARYGCEHYIGIILYYSCNMIY